MPRVNTPSFVVEFPLQTTAAGDAWHLGEDANGKAFPNPDRGRAYRAATEAFGTRRELDRCLPQHCWESRVTHNSNPSMTDPFNVTARLLLSIVPMRKSYFRKLLRVGMKCLTSGHQLFDETIGTLPAPDLVTRVAKRQSSLAAADHATHRQFNYFFISVFTLSRLRALLTLDL